MHVENDGLVFKAQAVYTQDFSISSSVAGRDTDNGHLRAVEIKWEYL